MMKIKWNEPDSKEWHSRAQARITPPPPHTHTPHTHVHTRTPVGSLAVRSCEAATCAGFGRAGTEANDGSVRVRFGSPALFRNAWLMDKVSSPQ